MKAGDIVKRKGSDEYASVHYSSFGISLHSWSEEYNGMFKTLGLQPFEYEDQWEVVEQLPEDWEMNEYGCPVKKRLEE
jgi:hypothetical protein